MKPLFLLSSKVGMCGTRLRIASHKPPLLPSPWHETVVVESSLHRIASHPIACALHWLHPSWKAACPFEYRQQTTHHRVEKCPWNLQFVSGSSVPGSPPHPAVSHCLVQQRIVPSSLTCRGCSHGFSTFIPDLVVCPLVCYCRRTEHYG